MKARMFQNPAWVLRYPAQVRPYFGYRNAERLVLSARVLRMREPQWEQTWALAKISTILGQFTSIEVPGFSATLEIAGEGSAALSVTAVSNAEGYLTFDCALPPGHELPEHPAWEIVRLHWRNRRGPQSIDAYVLAPGRDGQLAVISDIDDTVIETGVGDLARNWRRFVAEMPGERTVVPGAVELYKTMGGGHLGEEVPASRRPFFYVSSSPWNLFEYLVAFQKGAGLPQGPLLLRDWGFNRATLGRGGHGKHKAAAVRHLAEFYPHLRFALIGDDTQADALAFAEAVAAHPGRIAAVFIRRAPGSSLGPAELAALQAIEAAGVPLWTGESWQVGAAFLDSLGFTPGGETAAIVETIEHGRAEPAARAVPSLQP